MSTTTTAVAATPRASILVKMADRFSVEPNKLLETLKATAFKSEKGVTNEQMISLLIVADQYSLNPFTKEIFAFPDKGGIVPVVGVDGWSRIINEHPQFDGVEFSYDGAANDMACTCTIYRKDRAHPIAVTEYLSECKRGTGPWGSHPRRMLRHKALIQCARLAFGFAGIYDEDEALRIKDMGAADEVKPSSSIAAVREAIAHKKGGQVIDAPIVDADLSSPAQPAAEDPPADQPEPPPAKPPRQAKAKAAPSVDDALARINACNDADVLDVLMDEFRGIEDETVADAYRARRAALSGNLI